MRIGYKNRYLYLFTIDFRIKCIKIDSNNKLFKIERARGLDLVY